MKTKKFQGKRRSPKFVNWAGSVQSAPAQFVQPSTLAEVSDLVRSSSSVRVVRAGHSFMPVAAGTGTMLNLDHLSGVVSVDAARKRVRFLAGTRLRDVPRLLRPWGLALANQGDVDPQSLAGAISTSTHGTGIGCTGFAGTVTGLTVVNAEGELQTYSIDEDPELLKLVAVSLGAIGVVVEVEMQCVDAFDLLAEESGGDFEDILENFEAYSRAVDHFECYWFPHTSKAMVKRNTRLAPGDPTPAPGAVAAPGEPSAQRRSKNPTPQGEVPHQSAACRRSRLKAFADDELLGNAAFAAIVRLGQAFPQVIPACNRFATEAISHNRYRAPAHEVFVTPRRVRFHEMEYSVPLETGPDAVRELERLINRRDWRITFPLELRSTAADDVALSTGNGRESMYIAVHVPKKSDPTEYFPECEAILRAAGGRPHWGKMNTLNREDFAALYPRFDEFCAYREQVDPQWRFGSEYLQKVFG